MFSSTSPNGSIFRAAFLGGLALVIVACGAPKEPRKADPVFKLLASETRSYNFRYTDRSLSDIRPLLGSPDAPVSPGMVHTYRTEIDGTLDLQVRTDGRVHLWLKPTRLVFEADGSDEPTTRNALQSQLPKGAILAFEANGQLKSTFVPPNTNRIVMGLWQAIATRIQWSPPESRSNRWTAEVPDPNGTLQVEYTVQPDSNDKMLSLRRRRVSLELGPNTGASDAVIIGEAILTLAPGNGLLDRIESHERTDLMLAERPIGVSESTLSLAATGPATFSNHDEATVYSVVLPRGRVENPNARAEMEVNRLAGRKADDVWAAFLRDVKSPTGAKESYLALKALLFLHPKESDRALNLLMKAAPTAPEFGGIAEALADAGHRQARETLRTALQRRIGDRHAAAPLIAAMGGLRDPDEETILLLKNLAGQSQDPQSDSAVLALGRLANAKDKAAGFDAEPLVQWLIDHFVDARWMNRVTITCLALGNTANPRAEPSIFEAYRSSDSDLRGAAVTSLRWMPSAKADATLREALQSDPDMDVRRRAAAALGFRPKPENRDALIRTAKDKSASMRMAALSVLGSFAKIDPEIAACIRQAQRDPDAEVRRLAESLEKGLPTVPNGPK